MVFPGRSSLVVVVGSACLVAACADIGGGGGGGPDGGGGDGCDEPATWYPDRDGDGYGDSAETRSACARPAGWVPDGTDCDDADELAHPGADDLCNTFDDDCSGTADDGLCAIGCADGEREGFVDVGAEPDIAGCSGGFAVAGLLADAAPSCDRGGGDDGPAPDGAGCAATDLCGEGWHVCLTAGQVASAGGDCAGATAEGDPALFFATRQSGPGSAECGAGANDLFGCGNLGLAPLASCAPLDRFSNDLCAALGAPWACGADGLNEASNVTKGGPQGGGVLCCRD
ncbi:MAG TPA: putative metal-binding motif-containing protein [Kofleriaceae bacterium]|nr:putative metal-binding motif-containing protein [Kofleriaceae bacterium]